MATSGSFLGWLIDWLIDVKQLDLTNWLKQWACSGVTVGIHTITLDCCKTCAYRDVDLFRGRMLWTVGTWCYVQMFGSVSSILRVDVDDVVYELDGNTVRIDDVFVVQQIINKYM